MKNSSRVYSHNDFTVACFLEILHLALQIIEKKKNDTNKNHNHHSAFLLEYLMQEAIIVVLRCDMCGASKPQHEFRDKAAAAPALTLPLHSLGFYVEQGYVAPTRSLYYNIFCKKDLKEAKY